jgi:hypothetical protein
MSIFSRPGDRKVPIPNRQHLEADITGTPAIPTARTEDRPARIARAWEHAREAEERIARAKRREVGD